MPTKKNIADALDAMTKTCEDMDDISDDIDRVHTRFSLGVLTYEEASRFWHKEVREKKDRWVDYMYRVRAFKDWLINGGVSKDHWERLKPSFAKLNDSYARFLNSHGDFVQKLNVEYSAKMGIAAGRKVGMQEGRRSGKKEGEKIGYARGRKEGKVEALDIVKESNKRAVDEDRRSSKTPEYKQQRKELIDETLKIYESKSISMEDAVKEAAKKLGRHDVNIRSVMNQAYVERSNRRYEDRKTKPPKA